MNIKQKLMMVMIGLMIGSWAVTSVAPMAGRLSNYGAPYAAKVKMPSFQKIPSVPQSNYTPQATLNPEVLQNFKAEGMPENLMVDQPWMDQKINVHPAIRSGAFRSTRPNLMRATTPQLMSKSEAATILEVGQNASEKEIKAAYKKAAMKAHPDLGGSTQKMQEVNDAKEILLNSQNFSTQGRYEETSPVDDYAFEYFKNLIENAKKQNELILLLLAILSHDSIFFTPANLLRILSRLSSYGNIDDTSQLLILNAAVDNAIITSNPEFSLNFFIENSFHFSIHHLEKLINALNFKNFDKFDNLAISLLLLSQDPDLNLEYCDPGVQVLLYEKMLKKLNNIKLEIESISTKTNNPSQCKVGLAYVQVITKNIQGKFDAALNQLSYAQRAMRILKSL